VGEKKKAVLAWIYGGGTAQTAESGVGSGLTWAGFVVGSAANVAYNGANLAEEQDVVVVGLKYVVEGITQWTQPLTTIKAIVWAFLASRASRFQRRILDSWTSALRLSG
jgi:hypothetical protein